MSIKQEATHQIQKNEDTGIWYRWDRLYSCLYPYPFSACQNRPDFT